MMLSPHVTLIIKVTNACDMQCRYCFIEPSVFHKKMTDETARRVVRAFLDSDFFESVHFVWHGGEPLLRGRGFFERVFAEQRAGTTEVAYTNSTQTNGTHLDDDMLEFLLANDVSIGLSLDGPPELNDASRKLRRMLPVLNEGSRRGSGAGGHATTVDAARRLQERGRAAGAIVTVNRNNVGEPEAVYEEFTSRRIHMKINPLTRSGLADTALGADLGISAEEYGHFLVRMFDAWFDDPDPKISIEPFGQHIARILGDAVAQSCFYTLSCHRFFLGISPDGDLFPCGMFQGEPSFRYGNIHEMEPEHVARTVLFNGIEARESKVLATCSKCAFFDLCYSGCMFHSLKDAKILETKDYYCAGYKIYFEHALRRIHDNLPRALRTSRRA
ncbi:radical SAM protein [Streptomyces sp. RerS4]|uniref:radical SAM/SPASM domain-containing protein n=1 Tax=Streptomyces sp. RerS4 TaxID=2942449 RepID=UPI00201C77AF|nr:radical SAM protein [Streptomyces sp. RerS4]UQX04550.1 radical SAM protein [Streptomyces sp. RerS4]